MNFTSTRRALAGFVAACLAVPPVADILPPRPFARTVAAKPVTAPEPEPEPAPIAIPGLEQIDRVRGLLIVCTTDGRAGVLQLELHPDAPVRFTHMGGFDGEIPVPGNSLASFPNWFQREIGYAALGAVSAVEEA